jgi:NAD(P)-dependent dehydrogenase (short-subunit alcohol dehydrogenase family)
VKEHKKYRQSAGNFAVYLIAMVLAVGASDLSANDKGLVLVAGATGGTGRATVSELTRRGYQVRAFVRNIDSAREKLGAQVEFAEGDVRDRESIDAAMHGVSAVISAIGAGRGAPENGPEFVDFGGVKNIVESAADSTTSLFGSSKVKRSCEITASATPLCVPVDSQTNRVEKARYFCSRVIPAKDEFREPT